jgi:hypothetical protein
MANNPTIGVFIPGFLNTCNSPGPTGQQDAYGQNYPSGLNPGKMIELGTSEAQNLAAPGTVLYDGAYQWVQLDSGATAALATNGFAAFFRLDSGANQGALPETAYQIPIVTTQDQAASGVLNLQNFFAGVFINPVSVNGAATGPTPGNWTFIFVGAGRAAVNYGATVTGGFGGAVIPEPAGTAGKFESVAALATVVEQGIAATTPVANTSGVAYYQSIIYRLPN